MYIKSYDWKNDNLLFTFIGILITIASYFIAISFGFVVEFNIYEFIAVSTSYTCTILFNLQKRIAYIFGMISTLFLCIFYFQLSLPALAIFNGVLVLSLIYGFYKWGSDDNTISVTKTSFKGWIGYSSFFALIVGLFYLIVGGGSKTDIGLASGSATAQLMLDRKKIENWIIWILINLVSIYFYFNQGMILLGIQFIFFMVNAFIALYRWKGDLENV